MRLCETWRGVGRRLRGERDERAEAASLRVARLVLWTTVPTTIVILAGLVLAPLSDHQRGVALVPVLVGILTVLVVAGIVGNRLYRVATPISGVFDLAAGGLWMFGFGWAAEIHRQALFASASVAIVLVGALTWSRLARSRARARRGRLGSRGLW